MMQCDPTFFARFKSKFLPSTRDCFLGATSELVCRLYRCDLAFKIKTGETYKTIRTLYNKTLNSQRISLAGPATSLRIRLYSSQYWSSGFLDLWCFLLYEGKATCVERREVVATSAPHAALSQGISLASERTLYCFHLRPLLSTRITAIHVRDCQHTVIPS